MRPAGRRDCVLNEAFQKGSESLAESSACFELVYQHHLEQYWDQNKPVSPHKQKAAVVGLGTSLSLLPIRVISSLAHVYTNLFKARHCVPTCRLAVRQTRDAVTMTRLLPSGAYALFLLVLPDFARIVEYIWIFPEMEKQIPAYQAFLKTSCKNAADCHIS